MRLEAWGSGFGFQGLEFTPRSIQPSFVGNRSQFAGPGFGCSVWGFAARGWVKGLVFCGSGSGLRCGVWRLGVGCRVSGVGWRVEGGRGEVQGVGSGSRFRFWCPGAGRAGLSRNGLESRVANLEFRVYESCCRVTSRVGDRRDD